MRRFWTVSFCFALAASCTFDARPGKGKLIRCASDKACPPQFRCNLDESLCQPVDSQGAFTDISPPQFLATVDRAFLKLEATTRLFVAPNEALEKAPTVVARWPHQQRPLTFVAQTDDGRYEYSFDARAGDPEGTVSLIASAFDTSGNEAVEAQLPVAVTLDFTPPRLISDKSSTSPRVVRAQNTVSIQAEFTEAVSDTSRLRVTRDAGTVVLAELAKTRATEGTVGFNFTPPAGVADGEADLHVALVEDLAGNALEGDTRMPSFTLDSTPPVIGPLGLQGNRYSLQPGFNAIETTLNLSDPTATASVCVAGGICQDGFKSGDKVRIDVTAAFPSGAQPVSVSAVDQAGNQSVDAVETVTFDFVAPAILGTPSITTVAPATCPLPAGQVTVAGRRSTLRVSFTVNETVSGAIPVTAGLWSFSSQPSTAPTYAYALVVPDNAQSGSVSIVAEVSDLVGNRATLPVASMLIDATPPPFDISKFTFRRVPWGSESTQGLRTFTLFGSAGASEHLATVYALSSATLSPSTVLGTATAVVDGSVGPSTLAAVDGPQIYVQAFDAACNASPSDPARVRHVEWVASMGHKVRGSTLENPNVFIEQPLTNTSLETTAIDAEAPERLARQDGDTLVSSPLAHFVEAHRGTQALMPETRGNGAAAYDSFRKRTVFLGGEQILPYLAVTQTWEWSKPTWTRVAPSAEAPSMSRRFHSMVYDSNRKRVVLFGGWALTTTYGAVDDTWEWDGDTWKNVGALVPVAPSARYSYAMGYDPVRKRTVLFGGADSAGATLGDTWEWDGLKWTQIVVPTGGPFPRYGARMAFDTQRQVLLMYGGEGPSGTIPTELWSFNGSAWFELSTNAGPERRDHFALAYDSSRHRLVVHGGNSSITGLPLSDVWELNGLVWTQVSDGTGGPIRRFGHAFVFDSTANEVLVFGGWTRAPSGAYQVNDIWGWNGTTWTEHTPRWPFPGPRVGANLAFDPVRGRTLLFGGADTQGRSGDLYSWDGGTWTALSLPVKPPPREGAVASWDTVRQRLVVFGGDMGANVAQDTWEFDGTQWTQVNTDGGFAPTARSGAAATFDPLHQRTVLFGGTASNETCLWNGLNWSCSTPPGSPPAQFSATMTYDAFRQRVVMVGRTASNTVGTWDWDGSQWAERIPVGFVPEYVATRVAAVFDPLANVVVVEGWRIPNSGYAAEWTWNGTTWSPRTTVPAKLTFRSNPLVVWDSVRNRMVLFGGTQLGTRNDLWEYDGSQWFDLSTRDSFPSRRGRASATYDAVRERVVVAGNSLATEGPLDLWEWNGTAWTFVPTTGIAPSAREGASLVFDTLRSRSVLFGGIGADNNFRNEVWEWDGGAWTSHPTPVPAPCARASHMAAYDSTRNRMVVFGGECATPVTDAVWEWNGASWATFNSAGTWPSLRTDGAMAFDPERHTVVLFGGRAASGYLNDTWEWNGLQWNQKQPAVVGGTLAPRWKARAVWHAGLRRIVLFGGETSGGKLDDTWSYDGTTWVNLTAPGSRPTGRTDFVLAYDAKRQEAVLFGGSNINYPNLDDTWVYSFAAGDQAAHLFRVATGHLQLPSDAVLETLTCRAVSGATGQEGPGVALQLWDGWTWRDTATNSSAVPADVSFSLSGSAIPQSLASAASMSVRLVPKSQTVASQPTRLLSDYVEFTVRYSLP